MNTEKKGLLPFQIIIPLIITQKVKAAVQLKLNVSDEFQLNDRVDGIHFFNKMLRKVFASYAVEKYSKVELINNEKILLSKNEFSLENSYTILPFDIEEPILIPQKENTIFILVQVILQNRKAKIVGQISFEECQKYCTKIENNSSMQKATFGVLYDLKGLKEIDIF